MKHLTVGQAEVKFLLSTTHSKQRFPVSQGMMRNEKKCESDNFKKIEKKYIWKYIYVFVLIQFVLYTVS